MTIAAKLINLIASPSSLTWLYMKYKTSPAIWRTTQRESHDFVTLISFYFICLSCCESRISVSSRSELETSFNTFWDSLLPGGDYSRTRFMKSGEVSSLESFTLGKDPVSRQAGSGDTLILSGGLGLNWRVYYYNFVPRVNLWFSSASSNPSTFTTLSPMAADTLTELGLSSSSISGWKLKFLPLPTPSFLSY